jgi:hypothetical protein
MEKASGGGKQVDDPFHRDGWLWSVMVFPGVWIELWRAKWLQQFALVVEGFPVLVPWWF